MKKITVFILVLFIGRLMAQLPNTDIYLLDLNALSNPVTLSNPQNITNRPGYDNQPVFSPDSKYLLYTSIRDEKQSDIYKYDLKTKATTPFIATPSTSEYSATFMPDGKNISVVMVEPDSTQRLWKFPIKGGAPELLLPEIDSVGYHCWMGKNKLALCIITNPMHLIVYDMTTKKTYSISDTVGRSLHYKSDKLFYVDGKKIYSYHGNKVMECSKDFESEDIAFIGNNQLLIADNNTLYYRSIVSVGKDGQWQKVIDLSVAGISNITRIAVSPDGKHIAIVAEHK